MKQKHINNQSKRKRTQDFYISTETEILKQVL